MHVRPLGFLDPPAWGDGAHTRPSAPGLDWGSLQRARGVLGDKEPLGFSGGAPDGRGKVSGSISVKAALSSPSRHPPNSRGTQPPGSPPPLLSSVRPGSNHPSATSYVTSGNSLPSLSLSYSICRMGTIPEPTSWCMVVRIR